MSCFAQLDALMRAVQQLGRDLAALHRDVLAMRAEGATALGVDVAAVRADLTGLGERASAAYLTAPPIAEPAPPQGLPPAIARATPWTAARSGKAGREYAGCVDLEALLRALNALPGPPIASVGAMRKKASSEGWTLRRAARPDLTKSAGTRRSTVWSEARDALLIRDYPDADSHAVLEAINALPGPRVSLVAMHCRASGRKLKKSTQAKRAAGIRSAVEQARLAAGSPCQAPSAAIEPAPMRRGPAMPPPLTRDGAPSVAVLLDRRIEAEAALAEATWGDAEEWAARHAPDSLEGDSRRGRLARINAARRFYGLPGFTIVAPRGPETPLPEAHLGGAAA